MRKQFWTLLGLLCVVLLGCSKVDDYLLGKDNVPVPEALPHVSERVKFSQVWRVDVGTKVKRNYGKLSPVIHSDHLYLALPDGKIQDRDTHTGKLYWQKDLSSNISSGPTIAEGVIALTTSDARLMLLNQSDGRVLWVQHLSGESLAKPLIVRGQVFVKTVNGNLHGFEVKTGHKSWHWQHGSPDLILRASASPVFIPPNTVLVGYADGKLDALDLTSGSLLWQKPLVFSAGASDVERLVDIDADPLIYNRMALIGSYQGFLGALSLENNEIVWKRTASVYQNMNVGGGRLYLSDDNDIIWSINPNNGQVNWKQVHFKARGVTPLVWTNQGILLADKTGYLHLLSVSDGTPIGRLSLDGPIYMAPVFSGHRAFVLTENGHLYAIKMNG